MHLIGQSLILSISNLLLAMVQSLQLTLTHCPIKEERLLSVMSMVMARIPQSTLFWHRLLLTMAMSFVELIKEDLAIQRERLAGLSPFQIL
jgi:hypothetical protein